MTDGVKSVEVAPPEVSLPSEKARENFARLQAAKEAEVEKRIRAEEQNKMLAMRLSELEERSRPQEKDPFDGLDDLDEKTANAIKRKIEMETSRVKREAEEITRRAIDEHDAKKEKGSFMQRLKSQFHDYDNVMNEGNIARLEQTDPVFVRALGNIGDDYERRLLAYERIKKLPTEEPKPSIKDKVDENRTNPYFIPPATGTPSAMDYDLRSKSSRDAAYANLKKAQRQPINNPMAHRNG